MNFQDLKLQNNNQISTFTFRDSSGEDHEIQVKHAIPITEVHDLIQVALQKSKEDDIFNEVYLDVFFHLNIVYEYTNIQFSDEDREDEFKLYDLLDENDIIDKVISTLPDGVYQNLKELLTTEMNRQLAYKNTAAAVIRNFIQDLPRQAQAAKEIIDSFDPQKYQEVINFATAANGGRNINTQTVPFNPPASQ